MDGQTKKEYLMFLSREEINRAKTDREIQFEDSALEIINNTNNPNDVFAIYYTNPNIRIIKAQLITKSNFSGLLKI